MTQRQTVSCEEKWEAGESISEAGNLYLNGLKYIKTWEITAVDGQIGTQKVGGVENNLSLAVS